ncbi:MAG: hypothetical protein K0U54_03740, partial [Bacteroidetes bacterium]|nr:hypothetical protein [Bacteroidota bacterium]
MQIKLPSTKKGFLLGIFALVGLLLTSCITVQPVADRDGIYSNGTTEVTVEEQDPDTKNNYY